MAKSIEHAGGLGEVYHPGCFYCGRPNPGGKAVFGGSRYGTGGAPIDVCRPGEGCQDNRIYHGPSGPAAHYPDEDCPVCGPPGPTGATPRNRPRRIPTQQPRRLT